MIDKEPYQISSTDELYHLYPKLKDVKDIVDDIVKKAGGNRFSRVNSSTSTKIRNFFLNLLTFGYFQYDLNKELRKNLHEKKWSNAGKLVSKGAGLDTDDVIEFLKKGNTEAAIFILSQRNSIDRYDINIIFDQSQDIFHSKNNISEVDFYKNLLTSLNASCKNQEGKYNMLNCLGIALSYQNSEIYQLIIERYGQDKVEYEIKQRIDKINKKDIKFLINNGFPINKDFNRKGHTFLKQAIYLEDVELVDFLIKKGANFEIPASNGTPLRHAVVSYQRDIVKILLSHGANPLSTVSNDRYILSSPFKAALNMQNINMVKDFEGYVDQKDIDAAITSINIFKGFL